MIRSGTLVWLGDHILSLFIFSKYYTPSPEGRRTRTAQGQHKKTAKKIVIIDPGMSYLLWSR